jgi:hypothetical protein
VRECEAHTAHSICVGSNGLRDSAGAALLPLKRKEGAWTELESGASEIAGSYCEVWGEELCHR